MNPRGVWAVTAAAVVGALAVAGFLWTGGDDPRVYGPRDGRIGDGTLETTLPHFGVELPCEASEVRFWDREDTVGPGGSLYLRLTTTEACLSAFLTALNVRLAPATAEELKAFDAAPAPVDWSFGTGGQRETGAVEFTPSSGGRLLVDRGSGNPVLYLMADHAG